MKKILLIASVLLVQSILFAQGNLWNNLDYKPNSKEHYVPNVTTDAYFHFNIQAFKEAISENQEITISLPINNNEFVDFKLEINTTMAEGLMGRYPEIRAFNGIALDGSKRVAKVDVGPNYFRAMILQPSGPTLYIDPAIHSKTLQEQYVLYTRDELIKDQTLFSCHVEGIGENDDKDLVIFDTEKAVQSCELRTYRAAIAATGEYTVFHGGTVAQALAAQVTTLNRVNGIYERDLAITLSLISNNDDIIYTDAGTDPYTNGDAFAMLNENESTLTTEIGTSNFDIGHVFGTNSGGVASLNSVCGYYKARGVTGGPAPIGDPFDIDYVSHEMGHQFGANHTFNNSCQNNRNSSTAMEPGSGSTIMAYAGICNPNVQFSSDDYFHAMSLQDIGESITHYSHSCPVKTPLNNQAPKITGTDNIQIIPAGTPFILTAHATDADGDSLTYTWEQMNNEISTQPPAETATKGPSFRTYAPSPSPTRYLPAIDKLLLTNYDWEVPSTRSRSYKFRVTVRDNSPGGGCTDYKDITFNSDNSAGPFVVTYPSQTGISWYGGSQETVTWDVANTDQAPISCANVEVLISVDNGDSFQTLLGSTPNTGSAQITVPNVATVRAMIMVKSEDGTFFNTSRRRFKIIQTEVGLEDEKEIQHSLTIYPNPATDVLRIQYSTPEVIEGFTVYNAVGKVVLSSDHKLENGASIDISNLNSGVYFFETEMNGRKVVKKMIKE